MGMEAEVERPVRVLAGDHARGPDRQRGLSDAGHALDHGDPRSVAWFSGQYSEFVGAADKLAGLRRQRVELRRLVEAFGREPDRELRVASQDALMEFGEHRAWFCALLVNQPTAGIPVQGQRVTRPA